MRGLQLLQKSAQCRLASKQAPQPIHPVADCCLACRWFPRLCMTSCTLLRWMEAMLAAPQRMSAAVPPSARRLVSAFIHKSLLKISSDGFESILLLHPPAWRWQLSWPGAFLLAGLWVLASARTTRQSTQVAHAI